MFPRSLCVFVQGPQDVAHGFGYPYLVLLTVQGLQSLEIAQKGVGRPHSSGGGGGNPQESKSLTGNQVFFFGGGGE